MDDLRYYVFSNKLYLGYTFYIFVFKIFGSFIDRISTFTGIVIKVKTYSTVTSNK